MNRKILGLTGYAGSGKDALAQFLVENHGWFRVAFADKLKEVTLDLDPVIGKKINDCSQVETVRLKEALETMSIDKIKREFSGLREFYQKLGVALRDHIHADVWVEAAFRSIPKDVQKVVFTDARFHNEGRVITDHGGMLVLIERPGVGPVNAHVSDAGLLFPLAKYNVQNDGTLDDLRKEAEKLDKVAMRC